MFIATVKGKTLTINKTGVESVDLTFLTPNTTDGEYARFQVEIDLSENLKYNTAATSVCMMTPDNTYTTSANTPIKGFGLSFYCTVHPECTKATQVGVAFYGSTINYDGLNTYTWSVPSEDFSKYNIGSAHEGSGVEIATRYALTQSEFQKTNVPDVGSTSHLKCFTVYKTDISLNHLNQAFTIVDNSPNSITTATPEGTITWTQDTQSFTVTKPELTTDTTAAISSASSNSASGTSGATFINFSLIMSSFLMLIV